MILLTSALTSFFATLGFAVIFNTPRQHLLKASLNGALGWVLFIRITQLGGSAIFATFLGALAVGLIGEILANVFRKPATVFIIPAIIPFVPGYGIFYTMESIMQQNFTEAVSKGSESFLIAVAIASGLIISSAAGRFVRTYAQKKRASRKPIS